MPLFTPAPKFCPALRQSVRAMLVGGLLAVGGSAHALISFNFDYGTDPIFNDPTEGAARRAAVEASASAFATMFGSVFNTTGSLLLSVTGSNENTSTLASAGSALTTNGTPGFTAIDVVRTKLLTGVDANGAAADGSVDVNFGQPWQLSGTAVVSSTQVDFYSTMYHELTHALGFSSLIGQDGTSVFAPANPTVWGAFDRFVTDKNNTPVITPGSFTLNATVWGAASIGGASPASGLFFNGANARAANGGNLVGLYSPTMWENGSSGSHTDDQNPALAGTMMLAATGSGPGARTYSAIEIGILRDLGYQLAAPIPEPSTYALLLAGIGVVCSLARRRVR